MQSVRLLFWIIPICVALPSNLAMANQIEKQDEGMEIGDMRIGFTIEDPILETFVAAFVYVINDVLEHQVNPVTIKYDGFIFLSGENVIVDRRINPEYLPSFNQEQKDFVSGPDTHTDVCFVQHFDFNHENDILIVAHDSTGDVKAHARKCFLTGMEVALGLEVSKVDDVPITDSLGRIFQRLGD